jgi:hypothetical protein
MVNKPIDPDIEKLMTSFFSMNTMLDTILERRLYNFPNSVSVEELYRFLDKAIELVWFFRRNSDLRATKSRENPDVILDKQGPSFDNVGGLITVRFAQKMVPFLENEKEYLSLLRNLSVGIRRAVVNSDNSLPTFSEDRLIEDLLNDLKIIVEVTHPVHRKTSKAASAMENHGNAIRRLKRR